MGCARAELYDTKSHIDVSCERKSLQQDLRHYIHECMLCYVHTRLENAHSSDSFQLKVYVNSLICIFWASCVQNREVQTI